jgi:glycosyltransferase involved in cell wall biosynthesis
MSVNHEIYSSKVLDSTLDALAAAGQPIKLSVVMPCLNERETVGVCVRKAMGAFKDAGIPGEVIVADNDSTDRSVELAQAEGARVVNIEQKGYGCALKGGILAAQGNTC